jgi:hypothetical protein
MGTADETLGEVKDEAVGISITVYEGAIFCGEGTALGHT